MDYGMNIWYENDKHWNGITLLDYRGSEIERDGITAEPTWKGLENFIKRHYKKTLKDYFFSLGLVTNERKKMPDNW